MIGTTMGVLALIMIPAGFLMAWLVVRALDRRAERGRTPPHAKQATPDHTAANPIPLDDAPADLIAEIARSVR